MTRQQQLDFIAEELEYWLHINERLHVLDNLELDDDAHVYPPEPPTRKQIESWVEILRDEE